MRASLDETDTKKPNLTVPMITIENRIVDFGTVMNEVIQSIWAKKKKISSLHFFAIYPSPMTKDVLILDSYWNSHRVWHLTFSFATSGDVNAAFMLIICLIATAVGAEVVHHYCKECWLTAARLGLYECRNATFYDSLVIFLSQHGSSRIEAGEPWSFKWFTSPNISFLLIFLYQASH